MESVWAESKKRSLNRTTQERQEESQGAGGQTQRHLLTDKHFDQRQQHLHRDTNHNKESIQRKRRGRTFCLPFLPLSSLHGEHKSFKAKYLHRTTSCLMYFSFTRPLISTLNGFHGCSVNHLFTHFSLLFSSSVPFFKLVYPPTVKEVGQIKFPNSDLLLSTDAHNHFKTQKKWNLFCLCQHTAYYFPLKSNRYGFELFLFKCLWIFLLVLLSESGWTNLMCHKDWKGEKNALTVSHQGLGLTLSLLRKHNYPNAHTEIHTEAELMTSVFRRVMKGEKNVTYFYSNVSDFCLLTLHWLRLNISHSEL